MSRALILGGTGAIGRATARRLLDAGWQVELTGRDPAHLPAALATAGARFAVADRGDPGQLAAAAGDGADLLVDCVCFTAADAAALLPLARAAGSTVLISSKAVYVDSGLPVTVLRPSKIHGPGTRQPREWVFVRRVLDGRPVVVLAHQGAGVDHPTAAANVAALIETVAGSPGRQILNCADPDAPSGLEISRTLARHPGHAWEEVLLGEDAPAGLGRHPWDRWPPVVLDMTAAAQLGYQPAGDYAATVAATVDWLVADARGGPDAGLLPTPGDEYFARYLDYPAEDRYLAGE
jgi:nucleoside-diphosphate-sugar epimerase